MDKESLKSALKPGSKLHDELLSRCKNLVDMSRNYMSQFYDLWDANDRTIRGERPSDEQDRKAVQRGEPAKISLPFTYAQVHTFIAFFTLLFNQRSMFFEVEDNGEGDITPEGDAELCIDRDLRKSQFTKCQYQWFLDLARCGLCAAKSTWVEEESTKKVTTDVPETQSPFGGTIPSGTTTTDEPTYSRQGNEVSHVSPYKFFPDTRFPLSRFQSGEFCASEDEYSVTRLKQMEGDGMLMNTKEIQPLKADTDQSGRRRLSAMMSDLSIKNPTGEGIGKGMAIVTEVQVWLTPTDFKDDTGATLGDEDKPILFLVWYANDQTILRAEPMNYPHNKFCYDVGEYSADELRVVNESLSEIIDPLQTICTWFLNSHVTSVRKVIDNKMVVDPMGIEMDDIKNRSPIIRLKSGAGRTGIDQWIKQLEVNDVTERHIGDLQTLWTFMQIGTGINDNALGQFSGTSRPSATQAKAVSQGAASRLKTVAMVLWETFFVPMGEKMLYNYENLSLDVFKRNVGQEADQTRFDNFISGLSNCSFEFFDGTAPSEKGYMAQSMQDLLLGLMSNPQTAMMLSTEPFRSMVVEIADLRGIRSPERFLPPPQPTQPQLTNGQPPITVLPRTTDTGTESTGNAAATGATAQ